MANKIGTLYYDIDGNDKLKKILAEDKKMALELQKVLKDTNAQMGKVDLRQLKQYNSLLTKQQKDTISLEAAKKKSDDASILRQQKLQTEMARTEAAQKRAALVGTQGQQSLNRSIGISNKTMFSQNNLLNQLSQAAGIYFSIYQAGAFIKSLYTVSGEFEKQKISLAAILRDSSQAGILFERIKDLAVKSPFQFGELVSYTKQLSAFSVPYNELYDTTKRLADLSAGLGVDMSRLVLAFGQVRSASVLRGQELRQFTEAGIPLIDELAKKFTKLTGEATSAGDVFDKISRREVSFQMVKDIFTDLTSEGGKFYMMQEKQAESLAGKIANMKDSYQLMLNSIGEGNSGIMKDSVELLTSMMSNWESIAKVLKVLVATYGTYRAVLITINALQKASLAIEGSQRIAALIRLISLSKVLTAATYRQVVAQSALNAVMSINPIYAAAVAISALVGALVIFHKETKTTAELQTELYNKIAQQQQATESLNESVKSYLSTAADLKKSDVDRQKALDNLQKLMPSVFKNLSLEKLAVLGVTDAYKLYSKEVNNTARIGAKTNYIMSLQRLIRLENELNAKIENGEGGTLVLQDKIAQERAMLAIYKEQFSEQTRLANAQSEFNKKQSKWREEVDLMSKGATADIGYREDESYSDYISRIQDELEKATSANKRYKKENPFAKDEIDANNKQIQAYTKVLNKLGGTIKETSSGRAPSTSESDRRQKIKSNEDAITKIIADAEIERTRLKIQYAKDGYEKEQEQIQLNYDDAYAKAIENYKKVLTIAQETEKARWLLTAKKGEKFKSKITGYSDLTSTQKTAVDVGFSLAEEARISNINKLREQMVASSRDFNTKMQLIDKEYTDKVLVLSQTRTDANSDETDRAIAEAARLRDEAKSNLSLDEFQKQINWGDVFSDLSALSTKELSELQEKIQRLMSEFAGSFSKTDAKTLSDSLKDINDELFAKNPIGRMIQVYKNDLLAKKELKLATEELTLAQQNYNSVMSNSESSIEEQILAEGNLKKAREKVSAAQNKKDASGKTLASSYDKGLKSIQSVSSALQTVSSTLDEIGASDSLKNYINSVSDIIGGGSKFATSVKSGDIIGALEGQTQIAKGYLNLVDEIFGGNKAERYYQNLKIELDSYIETLERVIDSQKEAMDGLVGLSSVIASKKITDAIEEEIKSYRRLADARIKSQLIKTGVTDVKLKDYWDNISNSAGKTVSTVRDLYNLTPKQLKDIRDQNSYAWSMIDEEVRGYLENIIEAGTELSDVLSDAQEAFLGTSLDSVKSSLDDLLLSADTTMEDIAGNFEDYMQQAMLNVIKSNYLNKALSDWYDKFYDYASSDNMLTEKEVATLQDEYNKIFSNAQQQLNAIADIANVSLDSSDSEKSSGITASAKSLTEETGNILASYINAMRSDLSVIRSILDGSNSKGIYGQVYAIMQAYYPTIVNTLALQQAELVKIQNNTLRSANNSDGILTAIEELRSRFKQATTYGSSVKMNV